MTLLQFFTCTVLAVALFLPLYNAQFFGYPQQQSGRFPPSFSQFQQNNFQGFRPFPQENRQNGPQRQTNNQRRPAQQNNNNNEQVPWTEVGGNQQGGSTPWVEAGNNNNAGNQQGGQVPWVETGNNQQGGNTPWVEVGQGANGQQTTTQRPAGGSRPSVGSGSGCSCSSTSEYNPVCGSDNATYSNPGRLNCAIQCQRRSNQMNQTPITLVHYGVCRTTPETRG